MQNKYIYCHILTGLYDCPLSRAAPNCNICVFNFGILLSPSSAVLVNHGEDGTTVSVVAMVDEESCNVVDRALLLAAA